MIIDFQRIQTDVNELPDNKFLSTRYVLPNAKQCYVAIRRKNPTKKLLAFYIPEINCWTSYPSQLNQYDDIIAFAKIPYCQNGEVQEFISKYDNQ